MDLEKIHIGKTLNYFNLKNETSATIIHRTKIPSSDQKKKKS